MTECFDYCDELGPAKIIHVYEPKTGMKGTLVIDNTALGPALGGVRMVPDVTTTECFRLARAMTLKNASAGLAHGGGKAIVKGDPQANTEIKEAMIRAFGAALKDVKDYILAPDMGTDEQCMAWAKDETDRVVGLPRELGGIPLDEIGATAWGLRFATEVAVQYCDFKLEGARVVIQGFGNVGMNAAKFLAETGAVLVGAADIDGAISNENGLNVSDLIALTGKGKSISDYPDGKKISNDALIDIDCDIWIPAARPDVINKENVHRLKAKLVSPGANIGVTLEAEKILHNKGVICLPDFIANAGGVICAAMEYAGSRESEVFNTIQEKVSHNTKTVMALSTEKAMLPRQAAEQIALERVKKAMGYKSH